MGVELPVERPFLIVGHPRTGTGFAANLFRQLGYDIGHERDGRDGLSSWMFAVEDDDNPFTYDEVARSRQNLRWQHLIHPVRDPLAAAPSIILENVFSPISFEFRRKHVMAASGIDIADGVSDLDRAMLSLTLWSDMIEAMRPALTLRIEAPLPDLEIFLKDIGASLRTKHLDLSPTNVNKRYKKKHQERPVLTDEDWRALPASTKTRLNAYCQRYGYLTPPSQSRA